MEMKHLLWSGVLCLLLDSGLCDLTLFPVGSELTYLWNVSSFVGTVLPSEEGHKWHFQSTVIIQQQNDNTTLIKFTNVTNNQVLSNESALELPFVVTYTTGELSGLSVDSDDEPWSINIKRAFASMIQLKLDSIFYRPINEMEFGLYGNCNVEYAVYEEEDKTYRVRKVIDHDSCSSFPFEHASNTPLSICPNTYKNIIASDSERVYVVAPFEQVFLKEMSATGRLLIQPYQAKAEAHYSKIWQTVTFESVKPIEDNITLGEDEQPIDLIYEFYSLDPTFGKAPDNMTDVVNKIHNLLGELSDSLSSWEVGVKGLDNQTSFQILDLMWWLEVEDWQNLYEMVTRGTSYRQETIQHLYWDLVPQVGSKSAALFILNLITTNKVKGLLAGRLLVNFPFYIRESSEELLTKFEALLTLDEKITPDIKQSAVLSFASMVYKTCSKSCTADTRDKYAKIYMDKFIESHCYAERMLYLQGLNNMELSKTLDFLSPVVSGKITTDKNIRFLAVWATMHTVYTNPDKVYEEYWSLLSNRSETLELRVAALTLLIMSKPSPSRFFSLYWYMQTERSQQLYNFYYTTIQSLANTNYPCYSQLSGVAEKMSRFVLARSRHWATGNYILDFEDSDRAYGGVLQTLLIASERTGLPNVFMFMAEQHSLGHSRQYALYLKVEGLDAALNEELKKLSGVENVRMPKVLEILKNLEAHMKEPEDLHLELVFKVDGRTILCHYANQTTFTNWTTVVKRLSSLYIEFSVNYQSLNFPQIIALARPTDFGVPALFQMRSASLVSARGSISQETEGKARNAELDLRYSWNGVTTLRGYNPLDNTWYGADRCRNLHIRLPFATQLILHMAQSYFKVTAVRHRDFVTGSRLGMVWHASTRLVSRNPELKLYLNISDEWTMDSEDLGARLGASVFDCSQPDTLPDALHLLKKAFLANHKNYNMVPGGVVLLGLLSLKDQLQFQPPGESCGVMLYFTPLLTQVEPVLLIEGNKMSLSMTRKDGLLWEISAKSKALLDGNKEVSFKLYRTPSVSVTTGHIWRVIQFEGAFIVPSRKSGVFRPPAALTGYSFVSWGNAAPSQTDKAAMVDLKVNPGHNDTGDLYCQGFTPGCLQAASDLAARQTATLQYANLPVWLKMAAHALFPEHIQTEGTHTQVTFSYPVALLPWNTKGLCAVNGITTLTLDNVTVSTSISDCYSLAVADCSYQSQFAVLIKKTTSYMGVKVFCGVDNVELLPSNETESQVLVNGNKLDDVKQGYQHIENNQSQLSVRMRAGGVLEVELRSGVVVQHYNKTVVLLIPGVFRGNTCGLCGDFNGDRYGEPAIPYTKCHPD